DFLKKYKAKYGTNPDAIGGLAYDAAKVLFGALQKIATDDPETFKGFSSANAGKPARKAAAAKLRDLIAATKDFPGLTPHITRRDREHHPGRPPHRGEAGGGDRGQGREEGLRLHDQPVARPGRP